MTTTFILAGGMDRKFDNYGTNLARVVSAIEGKPVILSCLFSRTEEESREIRGGWDEWFRLHFGADVSVIHANKTEFLNQLEEANIVYLHGGRTSLLSEALGQFSDFPSLIKGKVVIGSSAGANYLARYRNSLTEGVARGIGLVNADIMVHWGAAEFEGTQLGREYWDKSEQELITMSGNPQILCLPEGEFSVFRVIDENH